MIRCIMSDCKRCGKCCVIYNPFTGSWEPCKYLADGNECLIYNDRIGKEIGYGFVCLHHKNWIWDIPGCTYFTGKKPIHPAYI